MVTKMLNKLALGITLCLFSIITNAEECTLDKNSLGADYLITKTALTTSKVNQSQFTLWRLNNYVAHENKASKITDIWDKGPTGKLKPSRYFDEYNRGIEYQPEDINQGKGDSNWEIKKQLVDTTLFENLQLVKETGKGCSLEQHYTKKDAQKQQRTTLIWLPKLALVKRYEEANSETVIRWNLEKVTHDSADVNAAFEKRQQYATTDFIDIGDNESDPFLLKMINLGFVEHNETGFYDTQGNSLSGDHSGHNHSGHSHGAKNNHSNHTGHHH